MNDQSVIETPLVFGHDQHLVGVLAQPKREQQVAGLPVVILSNVGLNHRVGPFRMWVDLARELACRGVASLRFDSSGLGDSHQRLGADRDRKKLALDMTDAIECALQRTSAQTVALVGLCSGTDAVHDLATADTRVVRAVFIDGYAYRTSRFYFHHILNRLLQTKRWQLFVKRRLKSAADGGPLGQGADIFTREYPTLEQFRSDVAQMQFRGCKLSFVYTGEVDYQLNYKDQFFDMLGRPKDNSISLQYMPNADHVFSNRAERERLLAYLINFLAS